MLRMHFEGCFAPVRPRGSASPRPPAGGRARRVERAGQLLPGPRAGGAAAGQGGRCAGVYAAPCPHVRSLRTDAPLCCAPLQLVHAAGLPPPCRSATPLPRTCGPPTPASTTRSSQRPTRWGRSACPPSFCCKLTCCDMLAARTLWPLPLAARSSVQPHVARPSGRILLSAHRLPLPTLWRWSPAGRPARRPGQVPADGAEEGQGPQGERGPGRPRGQATRRPRQRSAHATPAPAPCPTCQRPRQAPPPCVPTRLAPRHAPTLPAPG